MAASTVLVYVLRDLNDPQRLREADELARRTLKLRLAKHGPEHPDSLQSMHALATVLSKEEAFAEAEKLNREAIQIGEKVLARPLVQRNLGGSTHPDLLLWKGDLAFNLASQGKVDEALQMYEEVLGANLKSRGERHPYTLALRSNLASLLVKKKLYHDAERHYRQVVAIQKEVPENHRPDPLQFKDALAYVLCAQGQWDEAIELYSETLKARTAKYGSSDPQVVASAQRLAKVRAYQVEALQTLQQQSREEKVSPKQ
jgi:tetratricopeptide (TPR) repeat protein